MYKIFSKIFLSLTFVLTGFLFFSVDKVEAACVVDQANFRVVGPTGNPISIPFNGWYVDSNPPFVYIDFQTTGCTGSNNTFELSITEYDVDEDVNPVDWLGVPSLIDIEGFGPVASLDDDDVDNFNNIDIDTPSANNFTVALRAGDDECESVYEPNCRYYIRINDDLMGGVTDFNSTSRLIYNCSSGCDNKNWQFLDILADYQGVHPDDIAMQNAANESDTNQPISTGGTNININIQNPIGENTMTLVDFIDKVIKFALTIGIPIIAIAIIYSGLLFVTARGNDSQLETAKNAFTYAVIGGAILLGSWIFAKLIKETIESIVMIITYYG